MFNTHPSDLKYGDCDYLQDKQINYLKWLQIVNSTAEYSLSSYLEMNFVNSVLGQLFAIFGNFVKNTESWPTVTKKPQILCNYFIFTVTGVQSKNNAYHNVNKVQNSFTDALILNLIDIVLCVVFALYSRVRAFSKIHQKQFILSTMGHSLEKHVKFQLNSITHRNCNILYWFSKFWSICKKVDFIFNQKPLSFFLRKFRTTIFDYFLSIPNGTIENLKTVGSLNRNYRVLAEKMQLKKNEASLLSIRKATT